MGIELSFRFCFVSKSFHPDDASISRQQTEVLDEVKPLSASGDSVPGFLRWGVGGFGHVIGPIAAVWVLSDELDGDGTLDVIGNMEQLASHDPHLVLLEGGLGLGCWSWGILLNGYRLGLLLDLLWWSCIVSVVVPLRWTLLLGWGKLLLLVLNRGLLPLGWVPHSTKVVHDTALGSVSGSGDTAGFRFGA